MPRLRWNAPECFYSQLDEDVFFAWLHSITAVRRVESGGNGLVIWLKTRHLSKSALYDLIAVYSRYGGDLTQLRAFIPKEHADYFESPKMYWHREMFANLTKRGVSVPGRRRRVTGTSLSRSK